MTTPNYARATTPSNDEVTFRDLLNFLVRKKWVALASAVAFATATAIIAEVIPPEYTASVTLLPVTPRSGSLGLGALSSTLSQFSGLASMAGVTLGGATGSTAEALATLQSRLLTNKYISQHNLMPILFPKQWDSATNAWKPQGHDQHPTLWDADQLFQQHIRSVSLNAKTGVATLTIRWKNSQLAAEWANGLVKLTNEYLRQRALAQSEREISYLNQEIPQTNIVAVKTAIYSLMQQEIKSAMIAKGRTDFALRVIDPAIPPQRKSFPKPVLWTIGGALFGFIFGYFIALVRDTLNNDASRDVECQSSSNSVQETSDLS